MRRNGRDGPWAECLFSIRATGTWQTTAPSVVTSNRWDSGSIERGDCEAARQFGCRPAMRRWRFRVNQRSTQRKRARTTRDASAGRERPSREGGGSEGREGSLGRWRPCQRLDDCRMPALAGGKSLIVSCPVDGDAGALVERLQARGRITAHGIEVADLPAVRRCCGMMARCRLSSSTAAEKGGSFMSVTSTPTSSDAVSATAFAPSACAHCRRTWVRRGRGTFSMTSTTRPVIRSR